MINKRYNKAICILTIFSFMCLDGIINQAYSQRLFSSKYIKHPMLIAVGVGGGLFTYHGDIGASKGASKNSPTMTPGFKITVDQRFGNKTRYTDLLGLQANFLIGSLAETDYKRADQRDLSFKSNIWEGDVDAVLHVERLLNFNRRSRLSPYISVGVGYMHYDPTIWNAKYGKDSIFIDKTKPKTAQNHSTITIPVGVGIEYNITAHIKVKFDYHIYTTFSDWIDGKNSNVSGNTANDFFKFRSLSILYTFGKPTMKYGHKRIKSRF